MENKTPRTNAVAKKCLKMADYEAIAFLSKELRWLEIELDKKIDRINELEKENYRLRQKYE